MKNKDFFYLQLEKIFIENRMYKQPWFENASSKEELIDRTKKELEDRMEGVHAISDDYILKLFKIKNSYIAHYDGSKLEFEIVKDKINNILQEHKICFKSIKYNIGPTVTIYKVVLDARTRMNKVQLLEYDILLDLGVTGVRVIAPMTYRTDTFCIEVPNEHPQSITMQSIWDSSVWKNEAKMVLPVALGRSITGDIFMFDLNRSGNLLIAGSCGTGKSMAIDAMINSLIQKVDPNELKFVFVDPKCIEFTPYKKISSKYIATMRGHENGNPIITTCHQTINILNSLIVEYQTRMDLLCETGCRNIDAYNEKVSGTDKIKPHIIVVIDEFGDFILQAGKKFESPLSRLSQMGAFCGIHFIISTARPSCNIITGVIKANFGARMAFRTSGIIDSRTILDSKGAECLVGKGDMLFTERGKLTRIQCGYISKEEVESFTNEVDALLSDDEEIESYTLPYCNVRDIARIAMLEETRRFDPMVADVARFVVTRQRCSITYIQRTFEIGWNRATTIVKQLEKIKIISKEKGLKREVLVSNLDEVDNILHNFRLI